MTETHEQAAADVLSQVVVLGDEPTPQELALGNAVLNHIQTRPRHGEAARTEKEHP